MSMPVLQIANQRPSAPHFARALGLLCLPPDSHTRRQTTRTDAMKQAEDEHTEILRLYATGQIEAATTLLRDHILHVEHARRAIVTK